MKNSKKFPHFNFIKALPQKTSRKKTERDLLDQSIQVMNKLLDKIDTSKLPSAEEQLKDI